MTLAVLSEAPIRCDMALGAGVLTVTQNQTVVCGVVPFATIMDCIPDVNIPPMGECASLGNPETLAQTISAGGVLTPATCTPVVTSPWLCPNELVTINEMPMLDQTGTAICDFGGEISILEPLSINVIIP